MITQIHIDSELATIGLYTQNETARAFLVAFSQSSLSPVSGECVKRDVIEQTETVIKH